MSKSIGPAKWLFVPFQVPLMPSVKVPNVVPAFLLRTKAKFDFDGFEKVKSLNDIDLSKLKAKVICGPPVLAKYIALSNDTSTLTPPAARSAIVTVAKISPGV